tara:strand:- start:11390 stop:11848 length:459 start_codon:yes stop_codon:yes gene_type:complete
MAWEDEWYWQDELFGANPESGSWQDIAQSLLNPVYDPEERLLSRVLKDEPLSMAEIGENQQKDSMADPERNTVVRDREKEEANRKPFSPSSYTIPAPAKLSMPTYTVPDKEVGRVGGNANMYGRKRMMLNDTTEEEEMRRIAAALRRNQGYR